MSFRRETRADALIHQSSRDLPHLVHYFLKKYQDNIWATGVPSPASTSSKSHFLQRKESRPDNSNSGRINKQKAFRSDYVPSSASLTEHQGTFLSLTGRLNCCVCWAKSKHRVREERGFPEKAHRSLEEGKNHSGPLSPCAINSFLFRTYFVTAVEAQKGAGT